jgi:hypothetical protein
MVGSFLSWFLNKWLNKNKLKIEIQIKIIDDISSKILRLREKLYEEYKLIEDFNFHLFLYIKDLGKNEEDTYKKVDSLYNDIFSNKDILIKEFEELYIFLEVKEIVIKEFLKDINELDKSFWNYLVSLDELSELYIKHIFRSDLFELYEDLLPKQDFTDVGPEVQSKYNVINDSYKNILLNLHTLNEALLNKVYGEIFNKKKDKKIYEVTCGKLEPVERLYTVEKAKQIYKQNKIKKVFFD